jgi:hypothetical protein
MTEDPKLSQRYRELGSEEPPRHVDEAILAASRRSCRRWAYPIAAAAVIVLAVAVTVHVERDRPDPEALAMRAPTPQQSKEEKPSAPPPAAAPAPERRAFSARVEEQAPRDRAEAATADSQLGKMSRQAAEPAEKWLERIADLRKAGKHDEADRALEEFRRRYPQHKIPPAALRN